MPELEPRTICYYPGCSCHGTGREYDASTRQVCAALDLELSELRDWNCCGASSAHAVETRLSVALCARNFRLAAEQGEEVIVTPCAACFSRFKAAAAYIERHGPPPGEEDLPGPLEILHLLDVLAARELLEALEQWPGRSSLGGLRAVCYYGCLTVRPPKVTGAESPEDPTTMDRLLGAMGVDVCQWPSKTECCGSSLSLTRTELVVDATSELADTAKRAGAEVMVTACPMCFVNLDMRQAGSVPVPVMYFTELMALYMALPGAHRTLRRHRVSPVGPLRARGVV